MNSLDSAAVAAIGALGAFVAAAMKFGFDFVRDRMGWHREDSQGFKRRVEEGDKQARAEIARVEKELANRLNAQDRKFARLEEKVGHLPTSDDVKAMTREIGEARRETARVAAVLEGQALNLKTITEHLLNRERG